MCFFSIIILIKKPIKKPAKQALKLILIILMLLAAPLVNNTRSISNALAYLYTANVIFKAFTANKYKKLSAPPPLRLLKLS